MALCQLGDDALTHQLLQTVCANARDFKKRPVRSLLVYRVLYCLLLSYEKSVQRRSLEVDLVGVGEPYSTEYNVPKYYTVLNPNFFHVIVRAEIRL